MELHHRVISLGLSERADRGWARALYRGPRTVAQVLSDAALEMDEQDALAGDPVAWVRVRRHRRRAFWHRLLRRCGR